MTDATLPPEVIDAAVNVAKHATDGAIGAIERDAQRRRDDACALVIFHRAQVEFLRSKGHRWRLIARAIAKRRLRLAEANCKALGVKVS